MERDYFRFRLPVYLKFHFVLGVATIKLWFPAYIVHIMAYHAVVIINVKKKHFQGQNLLLGAQESDYGVMIGTGVCERVRVSHHLIQCHPPHVEPSGGEQGLHVVKVMLGSQT